MSTTVTTNLSLIKPDTNESIAEDLPTFDGWSAQNTVNCDKIDALFRASTHTWTPTWTGSGSNPTLGAGGFIEGKYVRLFPQMTVGFFRLYAGGAGFAPGTGLYSLAAPVAIHPNLSVFAGEVTIGKAAFYDDSAAATSSAFAVVYSTVGSNLFLRQVANDVWGATTPVTMAQQDRVSGYFMYPTQVV